MRVVVGSLFVTGMLVVAAGCGGSPKPGTWQALDTPKSERTIDHWTEADEDQHIQWSCSNVIGPDGALRCPSLERAGIDPKQCPSSLKAMRASVTDQQRQAFRLIVAGLSIADSCDMVDATFRVAARSLQRQQPPDAASGTAATASSPVMQACKRRNDDPFDAFDLTGEQMLARRGLGDRTFADTVSAPDAPIEVCGLAGSLGWLTRMTCADGSRPWGTDVRKAHASRSGARQGVARCGDHGPMIDRYEVPCPEKRYVVFMDMYECGPGEQLIPD